MTAPAPRWHSLRLAAPEAGAETRWLTLSSAKGIAAVRQLSGATWETQALRFRADLWGEGEARDWAERHNYGQGETWDPAGARVNASRQRNPLTPIMPAELKHGSPTVAQAEQRAADSLRRLADRKAKRKPRAASSRPARPAPLDLIAYRRRPVEPWTVDGQAVGMLGELDEVILPGGPVGSVRGWVPYPVRWGIIDSSRLIPSHVPGTWRKHALYPPGVQERDYGPATAERLKVEAQIIAFEPRLMLSDSRTAIDGPPLVTASGVVLGGNSRAMTLQAVYAGPVDRALAARDALVSYLGRSHVHGDFPRSDLLAMERPALVRVLQLSDADGRDLGKLRDLAARANLPLTQQVEPRRAAASAAARLDPETVREIGETVDPGQAVSEWLTGPGGEAVVSALRKASVITPRNESAWLKDGRLHAEGRTLALRILAAALVADPDLLDEIPAALLDELAASAAPIIAAAGWGHDVRPALVAALRVWLAWKRSGKAEALYFRQQELGRGEEWGDLPELTTELDRLALSALMKFRGTRRFPALWRRFSGLAYKWQPGADLYESRTTEQLLAQALQLEGKDRQENPRVESWQSATDEADPSRSVVGPWTVPDKGAADVVRGIVRRFPEPAPAVVVLWTRDPLGQPIPVGRYKADGRKLGDPRLRLVNPSTARPSAALYRADAARVAVPELAPLLRWLVASGREPGKTSWTAALDWLRSWANTGEIRHPWGVAAIVHADDVDGSLDVLDAYGFELRLWPKGAGRAEWVEPTTRRSNPKGREPIPAPEYFAKRVSRATLPWRSWVEALLRTEGNADLPGMTWLGTKELIDGYGRARMGTFAWNEYAWPSGPDGAGYRSLRDAYGYGILWTKDGKASWLHPPALLQDEE